VPVLEVASRPYWTKESTERDFRRPRGAGKADGEDARNSEPSNLAGVPCRDDVRAVMKDCLEDGFVRVAGESLSSAGEEGVQATPVDISNGGSEGIIGKE
jgi:hypothetical protein